MSYIKIENFKPGLDTRRSELTSVPGTLQICENAHITPGGEIEKRKAFVRTILGTKVRTSTTSFNPLFVNEPFIDLMGSPPGFSDLTSADNGRTVVFTDKDGVLWPFVIYYATTQPHGYSLLPLPTGGLDFGFFLPSGNIYPTRLGLQNTSAGLTVFGSNTVGAGLPTGMVYQQLVCPISNTWPLVKVVTSCNFGGKAWVVGRFINESLSTFNAVIDFVFYDGIALGEWWNGYLINSTTGDPKNWLDRMFNLINGINGFHTENLNDTGAVVGAKPAYSFEVYSDYGITFTVVASLISGTTTGFNAVLAANAITPSPSYGAAASFQITGGQAGTNQGIASFTTNAAIAEFTTANDHGFVVGDWLTLNGFNTTNNALNGIFKVVTTSTTKKFTLKDGTGADVSSIGLLVSQTAYVYRSAGILRLQVTTLTPVTLDLFAYTGTPICMSVTAGDMTADAINFAAIITTAINQGTSGFIANNVGNLISIYASSGTSNNNAYLTLTSVNDFCSDTAAFQITTNGVADTCNSVNLIVSGVTTNLLQGVTVTAADPNLMALGIANTIAKNKVVTGYTAAYLTLIDTGVIPNITTYNVVLSKVIRSSNVATDPLPTSYDVTMAGVNAVVVKGGYIGNAYFPTALLVTVPPLSKSLGYVTSNVTINVVPTIYGGLGTISVFGTPTVDYTLLTAGMPPNYHTWGTFYGDWGGTINVNATTSLISITIAQTRFEYIKGTFVYKVYFQDSSSPVKQTFILTGYIYFT